MLGLADPLAITLCKLPGRCFQSCFDIRLPFANT